VELKTLQHDKKMFRDAKLKGQNYMSWYSLNAILKWDKNSVSDPSKTCPHFYFHFGREIKAYAEHKTNHGTLEFVNYSAILVKFFFFFFFLVMDRKTGFFGE